MQRITRLIMSASGSRSTMNGRSLSKTLDLVNCVHVTGRHAKLEARDNHNQVVVDDDHFRVGPVVHDAQTYAQVKIGNLGLMAH